MSFKTFPVYSDIPKELANNETIIGTHDGNFHCDEALACAMLSLTKEFGNSVIVRTRNDKILEKCNVVVDVGAVYNPEKHRYDHHQATFQDSINENYKTRLSSAGLVYKHFGREVIAKLIAQNYDKPVTDKLVEDMFDRVYKNFIEHIDGVDNGVEVSNGPVNYRVTTTLSHRVSRLQPSWREKVQDYNGGFVKAMAITGEEFVDVVKGYVTEWLPARDIVEEAVATSSQFAPNNEVIMLSQFCPWKEHLLDIEKEKGIEGQVKYILFGEKSNWRIQCVPLSSTGFQNRLSLPAEWRGLRDAELSQISGIPNCVFVHASGFIGGNTTREGAIAMAKKSLEMAAAAAQKKE